jgi:hypothetical protein
MVLSHGATDLIVTSFPTIGNEFSCFLIDRSGSIAWLKINSWERLVPCASSDVEQLLDPRIIHESVEGPSRQQHIVIRSEGSCVVFVWFACSF